MEDTGDTRGRRIVTVGGAAPTLVIDVYDAERPRGAVICVHGFASARRRGKIEHLGAVLPPLGWTVIAPDLQGHGDSGGDFEGLTIGRGIDDVRRVAQLPEYEGAPRRVLLGSSFGGLVAAWAAADDPTICDGVVLVAPAFGYLERYLPTLSEEERASWLSGRPHVVRMEQRDVRFGSGALEERAARGVELLAGRLTLPTLIVHGTADASVPWQASQDFADRSARRDLELVLLAGADHRLAAHLGALGEHVARFLTVVAESPGSGVT